MEVWQKKVLFLFSSVQYDAKSSAHMEKEGRMVLSISMVTDTGLRSLCSLRLKKTKKWQLLVLVCQENGNNKN